MKSEQLTAAITLATVGHHNQFRRDGFTPYRTHLEKVASLVEGDEESEMVAWLHDFIEDTVYDEVYLTQSGIPSTVIEAVKILTHDKGESYQDYIEKIQSSPLARKVKIADILANLSDDPTERQVKKYAKALIYLLRYKK